MFFRKWLFDEYERLLFTGLSRTFYSSSFHPLEVFIGSAEDGVSTFGVSSWWTVQMLLSARVLVLRLGWGELREDEEWGLCYNGFGKAQVCSDHNERLLPSYNLCSLILYDAIHRKLQLWLANNACLIRDSGYRDFTRQKKVPL